VVLLQNKLVDPVRNLAASIVIGDKDLNDVVVEETAVLPKEIQFSGGVPPAGTVIPLASIQGHVTDSAKKPALGGSVTISGANKATFPIDSDGLFHIPGLLPGSYELTVQGSHDGPEHLVIQLGENNLDLDIAVP
ncbi:MAG TPA: carboxypeptidase-like regulatory domain-containing protein, partial [Terriglobia bacterium]|nr:carboxypeptidase-like regulatory domain-containing protein [Terriglobia bacterium]